MRGPFIPIYGFGAMTLLLVGTPLLKWPVAVFFAGMFAASILEYFTGAAMEAIFKVRYWDYSDKPFNINGHVCLFCSVAWGVLAVVLDYLVHKPIAALSTYLTLKELKLITIAVSVYFIVDLTLSFKAAFDLRDLIVKMEKATDELRIMQKRLDVALAYANASREEFMEEQFDKIEDLAKSIEGKFDSLKKAMEEKPSEFAESVKDEVRELRDKFNFHKMSEFGLSTFKGFYKRGTVLGNPTMASKKFKGSLESIKQLVAKDKNKKD